jgi:hypothetical protein
MTTVRKIHFIITAGYPGDAALTRRITTWWRLNQAVAGEDGRSDEGRSDDGVVTSRRTRKPGEGIEGSRTTAGPLTRATATARPKTMLGTLHRILHKSPSWGGQGSNLRPTDYESAALTD